ncbi:MULTISPECIES: GyrI-like domain-containing protein [Sediminibacillus]|uniref:GyrI-like domain-containing protein n=1 Tax=Sediminibacillus TaxID=482460 RepID=UPI00047CE871|nr:GyrI-like domain-containing protein [Sediminibacillus terrae]
MKYQVVTLPAYRAIGLKWEGTFDEIVPDLKNIIEQMKGRASELKEKLNPAVQLGLSYHVVENGFAHYAVYEVGEKQEIPEGMVEIRVPAWTYVKTSHPKGEDVTKTYSDLHQWLFSSDYHVLREDGIKYYDPYMPIKHEYYPVDQDPEDPHFDIYIPLVKK